MVQLLDGGEVMVHPFIIGELALSNLRQRDPVLSALGELPQIQVAADSEVLYYISEWALFGRGIGYIDAHLLASLRLMPGTQLWTRDQRLQGVAEELGLAITDAR